MLATGTALVLGLVGTILFAVAEARQRGQADQNARAALDEKREAQFQEYRARIAAATAAMSAHDVDGAARQLNAAPEELRGWEWHHLYSRLDDSSSVIPLPAGGDGFLLTAPDRLRVGTWTGSGLRVTDGRTARPRRYHSAASAGVRSPSRKPAGDCGSRRGSGTRPLTCSARPVGSFVACQYRRPRCPAPWP